MASVAIGLVAVSGSTSNGASGRSVAVVGQATVPGAAHVDMGEPGRTATGTCPHARRGLAFYRLRWRRWTELRQASVSGHRRPPRNCADARYLARVWKSRSFEARQAYGRWWWAVSHDPDRAILYVFGPVYGPAAVGVAECESDPNRHRDGQVPKGSVWAENGQYLGLFQMGSYARATFGHSSTVIGQVRAAHRYFVASGRDWSPWECQP